MSLELISVKQLWTALTCATRSKKKAKRKSCINQGRGFNSLLIWSKKITGLAIQELSFVIEPTGIYHESLVNYLYGLGATVLLVNPGKVRKFAEGIGFLSKNDIIDAEVLTRYGYMATKLIVWKPAPKEVRELQSLLKRLNTLEKELQREQNRQEKMQECLEAHPLEKRSIKKSIKRLGEEIKQFKEHIRHHIKETKSLRKGYDLLLLSILCHTCRRLEKFYWEELSVMNHKSSC